MMLCRVIFVVQGEDYDACLEQARLYLQNTGVPDYSVLPTTPRPEAAPYIEESPVQCVLEHVHNLQEEIGSLEERVATLTNLINAER